MSHLSTKPADAIRNKRHPPVGSQRDSARADGGFCSNSTLANGYNAASAVGSDTSGVRQKPPLPSSAPTTIAISSSAISAAIAASTCSPPISNPSCSILSSFPGPEVGPVKVSAVSPKIRSTTSPSSLNLPASTRSSTDASAVTAATGKASYHLNYSGQPVRDFTSCFRSVNVADQRTADNDTENGVLAFSRSGYRGKENTITSSETTRAYRDQVERISNMYI
ncbi:unnamed protein product [Protopolystoma xenopodis]|uniref:Uncharacterized protein n=1 Tax=Protopolystoma xenopodis TaxID=117903 RepID=A0A448XKQ6_9PLAT|nr:unnamed protein product [Protopolystoma xenopodis]